MWLYNLLKPATPLLMRGFFKQVFLTNIEGIPKNTPVILAVNHPTGFVDPIVLSSYASVPLFHMTRGDLFRKPLANYFLRSVNMFPVYRIREGFGGAKRNEQVFDYCVSMLADRKCLAIYVEGLSKHEKRLRPLQKGAARIAFDAFEENGQSDLQIIPVAANYSYAELARREAMFWVGKPIFIKDFYENFQSDNNRAINDLTNEIESQLRQMIIEIHEVADEPLVENLFQLYRNERFSPFAPHFSEENHRLLDEKNIAELINNLPSETKTELAEATKSYFSKLKTPSDDFGLVQPNWGNAAYSLLILIGFLPAFLGRILAWPPVALAHWVTKIKVKNIEFRSSVLMGVAFVGYLICWFLPILIASFISGKAIYIAFALVFPLWAYGSLLYFEFLENWRSARRALRLTELERTNLLNERNALLNKAFSNLHFRVNRV